MCRCSQETKDKYHVDRYVKHVIDEVKTQNRYDPLSDERPQEELFEIERPKSVQEKVKKFFSQNKPSDNKPKPSSKQTLKDRDKGKDKGAIPKETKRRDTRPTPPKSSKPWNK